MVSQIRGSRQIRRRGEQRVKAGRTKTFRRFTGKGRGGKTPKQTRKVFQRTSKTRTRVVRGVPTKTKRKVKIIRQPPVLKRRTAPEGPKRPLPPIRQADPFEVGRFAGEGLIAFAPKPKLIPAIAPSKRGQQRIFVERADGRLLSVSRKTAFRLAKRGFLSDQSQEQVGNLRPNPVFGGISQGFIGPPPRQKERGIGILSSGPFLGTFFTDRF